ncbi:hypothetical protein THASP1DRAFT_25777, partial [Thamnocephalis sphaerospora]
MPLSQQLRMRCKNYYDNLNKRSRLCTEIEKAEEKANSTLTMQSVYTRKLADDIINAYFAERLLHIQDEHVREHEALLVKDWDDEKRKAAIRESIGGEWSDPDSIFAAIYDQYKLEPGQNMADIEYGTVFTRSIVRRDPVEADLDFNKIFIYDHPVENEANRLSYAEGLIGMLNQARICKNIDESCCPELFHDSCYIRMNGAGLSSEEDGELLPFHADEQELRAVQFFIGLLSDRKILRFVKTECDIRIVLYALLMETKVWLTNEPYARLFIARDLEIKPGAAHMQKNDMSRTAYGLDVKPDFRLSVVLEALVQGNDYREEDYPGDILKRELCFMQSEVKKKFNDDEDFFFQMVDAVCRQEALLYGYKSTTEISNEDYAPFCVGTFVHGLQIDFYLSVPAHPDTESRRFHIYKYKTIKLPTNDGTIASIKYIEASVAFCNQIDLVRERLRRSRTAAQAAQAVEAVERERKRKRLNDLPGKSKAPNPTAKRRRGNEGQRDNGAGGGNGRGNTGRVREALEDAGIIAHDSFELVHSGISPLARDGTNERVSAANADSASKTDKEQ